MSNPSDSDAAASAMRASDSPAFDSADEADDDSTTVAGPRARYRARLAKELIRPDPLQAAVVERLEKLHEDLGGYRPASAGSSWRQLFKLDRRKPMPRGLYLYGGVGRGKSMLMDLFFASAPIQRKRRVHFHAFMAEIQDRLNRARKAKKGDDPLHAVADEIAEQTWLLCFDEFVVYDIADAMILGRLFEAFFERGVVVVATSNFAPDDLYKDGLQRDRFLPFIALIKQDLDVMPLDGTVDYRLARMVGRPVYYSPLGAKATQAIDKAWDDLTDNALAESATLEVKGRQVLIPAAAKGVARFDFEDLCDKPLGPRDYLAIAQAYHTVLIDGVPILNADRYDVARRFITAIDSFYEAKTRLIMAASAPPATLYPTGRGAFEFERTVSRLMEMQGAEWWTAPRAASAADHAAATGATA